MYVHTSLNFLLNQYTHLIGSNNYKSPTFKYSVYQEFDLQISFLCGKTVIHGICCGKIG